MRTRTDAGGLTHHHISADGYIEYSDIESFKDEPADFTVEWLADHFPSYRRLEDWLGHRTQEYEDEFRPEDGTGDEFFELVSPHSEEYNCIAFVFSDERIWMDPDDVDIILKEDKLYYEEIKERLAPLSLEAVAKNDIAVYRNRRGDVTHAGIVDRIDASSSIPLIRSKWGACGEFIHQHASVPEGYGSISQVLRTSLARSQRTKHGDVPQGR